MVRSFVIEIKTKPCVYDSIKPWINRDTCIGEVSRLTDEIFKKVVERPEDGAGG